MEKIVYILGAGFSAPLGLPVMSNFLEKSKDLYFENPEKYKHFKKIFDRISDMSYCKNYYNTDLFNIEEILSILEMNDNVSGNSEFKEIFAQYLCDVIEYYTPNINSYSIIPELSDWYKYLFADDVKKIFNYYGYFICSLFRLIFRKYKVDLEGVGLVDEINTHIEKPNNLEYSIITLNYDMVVESFIIFAKEKYKEINSQYYGFNRSGSKTLENNPWLVKLHGSVEKKEIIAPTWNKFLKPSIILYEWKRAYELLKEANQIRIIGYSLPITDSYIKYLLKTSLVESENKHFKKIDVICKDPEGLVKKRYDEFINFRDFEFKNTDCTEYFKKIYDMSLSIEKKKIINIEENLTLNKLEDAHSEFFNN